MPLGFGINESDLIIDHPSEGVLRTYPLLSKEEMKREYSPLSLRRGGQVYDSSSRRLVEGVRANFDETDKLYLEKLCFLVSELMGKI